ncbi:hypothetical protein LINGRAHAP2_LOCUS25203 [Linum grandiflorum]
MGNRKIPRKLY